jgi:putative proteasome-type protease
MTYCVAVRVSDGIVMLSDSRTNAGVDNISRFAKMFTFENPGERVMAVMTAGNLSMTQGVISRLRRNIQKNVEEGADVPTLLNVPTLFHAAQLVGAELARMQEQYRESVSRAGVYADASILLAGQRVGGKPRLFLIYSAGNFIEATRDTPFFQIGEHKYGKPILDRVVTADSTLDDMIKAVCLSMDSTMKSNLSVGMPLDLAVLPKNAIKFSTHRRIERDDPSFIAMSKAWEEHLRGGFENVPNLID